MEEQTRHPFNHLIVSDLHLQEAEQNPLGRLYYFDQEFTDFLRHYRQFYEGHRRWRLIIGGDFVEFFVRFHEHPDPEDKLLKGAVMHENDYKFFPGTEAKKSVWKLDRIVRSHQLMFIALARFIWEGNELYILRGNHDLEFFWPEVQRHFCDLLAQFHPAEVSYLEMKRVVESAVHFVPWFYFVKDLLYVEHGHQYDPCCSNVHNLWPVLPRNPSVLEVSFASFTLRYFVSRIHHLDPAAMENVKEFFRHLWHMIRANPTQALAMPIYMGETFIRTLGKVRKARAEQDTPISEREAKIREEILAANQVSAEAIRVVEGLVQRPVLLERWETIKSMSLDLLAVIVLALIMGVTMATSAEHALAVAAGMAVALLVPVGAFWGMTRRAARLNDYRHLREIARTIRNALGCRYVVFGHSHDPDVHRLSPKEDHWYFNVGTWNPHGLEGQFVYLEIVEGVQSSTARLMKWDRRSQQPVQVDLASYSQGTAEREALLAGEPGGER